MPSFGNQVSDLVDQIRFSIKEISDATYEVQRLTKTLGSPTETSSTRPRLFELMESTPKLSKATTSLLKQLEQTTVDRNDFSAVKEKKLLSTKLLNSFKQEFNEFNNVAKNAAAQLKSTKNINMGSSGSQMGQGRRDENVPRFGGIRPLMGPRGEFGNNDDPYSIEPSPEEIQERKLKMQNLRDKTNLEDRIVEEEHQQIKNLGQNITELHTIFNDLATIVNESDIVIDDIERHMDQSVVHTSKGVEQLETAHEYQKSTRTKTCFLVLLILVLIIIALAVTAFLLR